MLLSFGLRKEIAVLAGEMQYTCIRYLQSLVLGSAII